MYSYMQPRTTRHVALFILICLLGLLGFVSGCGEPRSAITPEQQAINEQQQIKEAIENRMLPAGTKLIQILGNKWCLVEVPIGDKRYKAVFRQELYYRSDKPIAFSDFAFLPGQQ